MKNKKRRKRKYNRKVTLFIFVLIVLFSLFDVGVYFYMNPKDTRSSVHAFAKTYKTNSCRVYYPKTEVGYSTAKKICNNNTLEDAEYDFTMKQMGDYYLVSYETGDNYFIDGEHNDLVIKDLIINEDSKILLADYLRYNMKKDELDIAYTSKYLYDTYYENIDLSNLDLSIDKENLYITFNDYNYTYSLPLGYVQKYLDMDFGYEDIKYEQRVHFVSPNRKVIGFTYDDGPNTNTENPTSFNIVKNLDTYDSSATFFVVGSRLDNRALNLISNSIDRGMEYGSHTYSHSHLPKLSLDKAIEDVLDPYYTIKNSIGYEMKYYRPPYGEYTDEMISDINLKCIVWNVDSLDWKLRLHVEEDEAVQNIYNHTLLTAGENDVVLFHDLYRVSELSSKEIMKTLIDEGYQVVNISELLDHLDMNYVKLFGGK